MAPMTILLPWKEDPMPSMAVRDITLESVTFQVNHGYTDEPEKEGFAYKLKRTSHYDEKRNTLIVSLGVETPRKEESPDYPFYFDIVFQGAFVFTEPISEELQKQYATVNCPAILFPYLREALADLTRRGGFPPLHLPVTNFVKLAKSEEKPAETAATKGTSGRKRKVGAAARSSRSPRKAQN